MALSCCGVQPQQRSPITTSETSFITSRANLNWSESTFVFGRLDESTSDQVFNLVWVQTGAGSIVVEVVVLSFAKVTPAVLSSFCTNCVFDKLFGRIVWTSGRRSHVVASRDFSKLTCASLDSAINCKSVTNSL